MYSNNNNNYNNNNNEYNIQLYNSVWNNIYLKSIIFNHSKLFNYLFINIKFKSIEDWEQFKYKEYLNCVTFGFEIDLNKLPENITKVYIKAPTNKNDSIQVPDHIDSVNIFNKVHSPSVFNYSTTNNSSPYLNSFNSKLKSLSVSLALDEQGAPIEGCEKDLQPNSIPQSVTNLNIGYLDQLKNNTLPNNLKQLSIQQVNSFENNCLPESITHVEYLSSNDPLIINQFSSNGLNKLNYSSRGSPIGQDIRFPTTLKDLCVNSFSTFNGVLPDGLKSFKLYMEIYKHELLYPSTLEQLVINFTNNALNQEVFKSRDSVPCGLKLLDFPCSSIIDSNGQSILPNTLETLRFSSEVEGFKFNQVLQVNQLPSSLTCLDLGSSFNQIIDVGVLPSALKKLVLGYSYTQVINPLAIPQQLELLEIRNEDYNEPIHLPPSTHPYTFVLCPFINVYYNPSNTDIRVLRLPNTFNSSLSTLQLQDKSKLEYLHLGGAYDETIQLSDLPINNQIKTLELGSSFGQTINLEYFQNLETIIINYSFSKQIPNIITTTTTNNNNTITYNNYKLNNIIVPTMINSQFIKQLDINFYKFLKFKSNK